MTGIADWASTSEPYGPGRKAPLGAALDVALLEAVQRYKRQVAKRYRVVEPDAIERLLPDNETLFVSPKLDGELWFLVHRREPGDVALVAFNGRVLHGVSMLAGLAQRLAAAGAPSFVLAGELHVVADTTDRPRVHHLASTLADPRAEPNLAFSAFDVLEAGGKDALSQPYAERLQQLHAWLGVPPKGATPRLSVVATEEASPPDVAKRYRRWVTEGGGEGVVVRSDRGLTYKIKPTTTVDVVIVAYGERITGDQQHVVRELQVALLRDDGTFQLVGSVGGGLSEDERIQWRARLEPLSTKSSFRLANREGTLCRFVRPEIVVELKVSDFITTDGWDVPLRRMSLAHDQDGWRAITEARTPILLHPVLIRERTDKKVDLASVGFTQLTSYLENDGIALHGEGEHASARTAVASTIEARRVFTKSAAKGAPGDVAVRKVVIVRTHKEHEGTHPPYVVFTTDFSPNRKTPLETALRTAPTREEADRVVAGWLEENVKRGWVEVGAAPAAAPDETPKEPASGASTSEAPASDPPSEPEPEKPKKRAKKA